MLDTMVMGIPGVVPAPSFMNAILIYLLPNIWTSSHFHRTYYYSLCYYFVLPSVHET